MSLLKKIKSGHRKDPRHFYLGAPVIIHYALMFDLGVVNNLCTDQLYSCTQLQCITGQCLLPGSPSAMHTLSSDQTKSKQEWEIV